MAKSFNKIDINGNIVYPYWCREQHTDEDGYIYVWKDDKTWTVLNPDKSMVANEWFIFISDLLENDHWRVKRKDGSYWHMRKDGSMYRVNFVDGRYV